MLSNELLRSALDQYGSDLRFCSDQELEDEYSELVAASRSIEQRRLARLAEIDKRKTWAKDGFLSTVSWAGHRFGLSDTEASADVHLARDLDHMPKTSSALQEGEIAVGTARALASCKQVSEERFKDSEDWLVDAAKAMSRKELSVAVALWRQRADAEAMAKDDQHAWNRRSLKFSKSFLGMGKIDGDLDPDLTAELSTALAAVMDKEVRQRGPEETEERSPAQVRHDALGVIVRHFLDSGDLEPQDGRRHQIPHLLVVVDEEVLRTKKGIGDLEHVGPISPSRARKIACDASVTTVVTSGGIPTRVGRRTRVVSERLRAALYVRDGGCTYPGCGRPRSWCDVHHIKHWADGGETTIENTTLICRIHHGGHHDEEFEITMEHGRPVYRRPDGRLIEDRGPPGEVAS